MLVDSNPCSECYGSILPFAHLLFPFISKKGRDGGNKIMLGACSTSLWPHPGCWTRMLATTIPPTAQSQGHCSS